MPPLALLAALALAASAQAEVDRPTWTLVVKEDGSLDAEASKIPEPGKTWRVPMGVATLVVLCAAKCPKDTPKVFLGEESGKEVAADGGGPAGELRFTLAVGNAVEPVRARVIWGKKTLLDRQIQIQADSAASSSTGTARPPASPAEPAESRAAVQSSPVPGFRVVDFLKVSCNERNTTGWKKLEPIAEDKSTGVIVSATGDVLSDRALENVSEDDSVTVEVVAEPELLPFIRVTRKSPTRVVGGTSILGADLTIPVMSRQAAGCAAKVFTLSDFAPGTGVIEVEAMTSAGPLTLGRLEFPVNRLYTGMFSLGPFWTSAVDANYGLVWNGSSQIVSAREKGKQRMLYALFYTPFVWGKRDIEIHVPLHHRLNPTLGLVLNDVANNALVGISADFFDGFVVTFGGHLARVSTLDPSSGLAEGAEFTGDPSRFSTAQHWIFRPFVAISVDLRAAVQFLKAAISSAGH